MLRANHVLADVVREHNLEMPADGGVPGGRYRLADVDKPRGRDGWLVLFEDGLGGLIQNWRLDDKAVPFFFQSGHVMTPAERVDIDRRIAARHAERAAEHARAAAEALAVWNAAFQASPDHPYLQRKGISGFAGSLRMLMQPPICFPHLKAPVLIVPGYNTASQIQTVAYIDTDGAKFYHPDAATDGAFCVIPGALQDAFYFAEGFSTGATIAQAMGRSTVVCFDAGNLPKVAKAWRAFYPDLPFIICADDDGKLQRAGKPNKGLVKATEAAQAVGGFLAVPEFMPSNGVAAFCDHGDMSDFNDLARIAGIEAVQRSLAAARPLAAVVPNWLEDPMPEIITEWGEADLAEVLARTRADDLRFVDAWNRWMIYEGGVWRREKTRIAYDLIGQMCRELIRRGKTSNMLRSAKTRAGVEQIAKADRRMAAVEDQWDRDPWLLNTPAGTVDLRTGQMSRHDPMHYITQQTSVAPAGYCPRWRQFLAEVTKGDASLQSYLQRLIGYCVTGCTHEQILVFFYGAGRNGKGVFIDTISSILDDYHKAAPIETFMEQQGDRHPTDLADLRGARLVTSQEVDAGKAWNESRIKQLTGQDIVKARFMRGDFFEYRPVFQLIIVGNNKPRFSKIDAAISSRMQMVPFLRVFADHEQDKGLREALKAEASGILQWMIDGCVMWQREGLNPPEIVRTTTADYLEGEDLEAQWLDECCVRERSATATLSQLFNSWCAFASGRHGKQRRDRDLADRLVVEGFTKSKTMVGVAFEGIRLRHLGDLRITNENNVIPMPPRHQG